MKREREESKSAKQAWVNSLEIHEVFYYHIRLKKGAYLWHLGLEPCSEFTHLSHVLVFQTFTVWSSEQVASLPPSGLKQRFHTSALKQQKHEKYILFFGICS